MFNLKKTSLLYGIVAVSLVLIAFMVFRPAASTLDASNQLKTIEVTGSATAYRQANKATITLGVQTQNHLASEAVRINAELMNAVIEAMMNLGVSEKQIKTVSYSVYPVYDENNRNLIVSYNVINMISIELREIDLIGEVIDTAARNGANKIQSVSFGLSDENHEELKMQAYLLALNDAEMKADLIAERLGLTITGVQHVSESTYSPYRSYISLAGVGVTASSTPIIEGKLSISITVHLIYTIE